VQFCERLDFVDVDDLAAPAWHLGGYINHVLPDWLTTVSLAALLAFITHRLVQRALLMRREAAAAAEKMERSLRSPEVVTWTEEEVAAVSGSLSRVEPSPVSVLLPEELEPEPTAAAAAAAAAAAGEDSSLRAPLLGAPRLPPPLSTPRRRLPHFYLPLGKLSVLLLLVGGVVSSSLLKHRFRCPSPAYWAAALGVVPLVLGLLWAVRRRLLRRAAAAAAARLSSPFAEPEDDVAWTPRTTLLYPALCTFAGVCAGMFGVGGGIVKGPLMLEMGVPASVAAATSATMILLTSSSASAVFISFGAVPADYGTALFLMGTLSTAAGQAASWAVARRTNSKTLIVELMAVCMGLSALALAAQGGVATAGAARRHELWRWGSVCRPATTDGAWGR
jgi:uncharacterized membrane protein YfcA